MNTDEIEHKRLFSLQHIARSDNNCAVIGPFICVNYSVPTSPIKEATCPDCLEMKAREMLKRAGEIRSNTRLKELASKLSNAVTCNHMWGSTILEPTMEYCLQCLSTRNKEIK